ncbi:hypothetical protein AB1M95_12385 [Sulfitobacter sp. LCG007]
MRAAGIVLKLLLAAAATFVLGLFGTILWVETQCRGPLYTQAPSRFITSETDRRPEGRSFLTYPEWHVVFTYRDYAETLFEAAPQDFGYWNAVRSFWTSSCAMNREADRYGDAGTAARQTLYVVGASFTTEMAAKAVYENTLGRLASLAGTDTEQDRIEEEMAADYAEFLEQTPWYRFDFAQWRARLWDAPVTHHLRGWERRIALGIEWSAKAAYAQVIAGAVAATGQDETDMLIVVTRLRPDHVDELPSGRIIEPLGSALLLRVPRYEIFTRTADRIAAFGGEFVEIAGNDDILVSLLSHQTPIMPATARVVAIVPVNEIWERYLVAIPVESLAGLLRASLYGPARLEHIYDY